MSTKESKPVLSLADFNASAKCENAFEFPYLDENGKETSWLISVIGDQAPAVKRAIYSKFDKKRKQEDFAKKRGKEVPIEDFEEIIADNFDSLAACIVGWSGITEPYSHELAKQALENNKLLAEQVKSASEDIKNFTKGK
jgi:hypothetical protein